MKRYREAHDFYHVILALDQVDIKYEVLLKWFELFHFHLPMNFLAILSSPMLLTTEDRRWLEARIPWAISTAMGSRFLLEVEWENLLNENIDEVRKDLGVIKME